MGMGMSLILREEHKPRVLENRVLRRIFRLKKDEVTGEWRTLHNEFYNLYPSLSIRSRRMRRSGYLAQKGKKRNAYRILGGEPD
jgi:hypothetical protein